MLYKFKKKLFELLPEKLSQCCNCEQRIMSFDNFLLSIDPTSRLNVKCKKCEVELKLNTYGVVEFFVILFVYLILTNFILDYVGFYSLFKQGSFYELVYHIFTVIYLLTGFSLAFFPAQKYGRRMFIPK